MQRIPLSPESLKIKLSWRKVFWFGNELDIRVHCYKIRGEKKPEKGKRG